MTFAYHVRAMPAWMNPPSPSPPPMPDTPSPPPGAVRPGWWDNKVTRQDKDLGGSVLLWVLLAIPALLLLHCCLVRGCFCYDDEEETIGARRIRARLRARRRRRAGELDATDSDRSDSDVEPVSPAAWDAPTRAARSAALSPFHARDGSTGTFTNESIHEWRMLAMERERARARTPGHPSPLGPRDDDNDSDNNDNNNAPARTRRAHRRVSPEAVEIELESEDDQTEHEPGPMTSRAMATLPRCFVGDNRWRALRGLEPVTPAAADDVNDEGHAAARAIQAASDDIEVCLVCTDDCEPGDELIVLTCHHSFHADCIKRWLKVNAVCPTCRARVTRVTRRERAALWYSGWGTARDDVTDGDGGDGWKEGGDEEIVVNVVS